MVLWATTWLSYFWLCQIWVDSLISGLVIYDLTLSFLVLLATTCLSYSCLIIYDLFHLFLILSLRLDSLISGIISYKLTLIFLFLSLRLDSLISYLVWIRGRIGWVDWQTKLVWARRRNQVRNSLVKECCVLCILCVLFRSLQKNIAFFAFFAFFWIS